MTKWKQKDYLILNDIFQYSSNPCQSLNLLFHFTHMCQMWHVFIILKFYKKKKSLLREYCIQIVIKMWKSATQKNHMAISFPYVRETTLVNILNYNRL